MSPTSRRRPGLAVGCALAAIAATLVSPAWADPAPTYAQLLAQLGQTPATLEAGANLDAAEARVRQARVRPNPVLGLDVENAYGSGPFSGMDNADTTLALSTDLELWGRRASRIAAARAEAGAVGLQRDLAVIDAAGRLALVYSEAEAAQRRAALADEVLTLTLADARAALALVEEGREPLLRGIQGEAEVASARAALDEAVAERDAAYARLTAVAMIPSPVTRIDASLLDQAPTGVGSAISDAPTVRVAEAERTAAERRIDVQRVQARPDINASVGIRRFEAEDATALTFGISMPLPLFDRNRGNIEAAQAEFRAADARLMSARQEAQADRAAAVARLAASVSRVAAADAGVTAAEEAYRLSRIGFEAGRISQVELRVTRTALVNARSAAVDARLARVRAEIDLARLDGRAPFQGAQ
ncbi:TolC family protein [Brevundimonas sp.]|jgi:cobalt-zinc-cadmium efflux system outer membrane protein|uniref:TolC family protein n=1 Tax=Brevundimonas TaxID=41275 RepID=UPI00289A2BFA|nr:TolC family protein [Brevundimonas sp.]